jgi:tetratricopeptide (TPR) repeat protein
MIAGDFGAATRRLEQAITLSEQTNNPLAAARALRDRGNLAVLQGHFEEAEDFQRHSIALWRNSGHRYYWALALNALSRAHWWRGLYAQAHARLAEAQALVSDLEHPQLKAWVTTLQAMVDLYAGGYKTARGRTEAVLPITRERDAHTVVMDAEAVLGAVLGVLGWLALVDGEFEKARDLCAESVAAYPHPGVTQYFLDLVAWSQVGLGLGAYGMGNKAEAQSTISEALERALAVRSFPMLLHLMPAIPVLLIGAQDVNLKERAIELYALASSHPFVGNSPLLKDLAGKHITFAIAELPSEMVAAAQERGQALDWWDTAKVLLEELRELGWAGRDA